MVSLKNNLSDSPIPRAECREMCPDAEFNMRVTNDLVNNLEKKIIKCDNFFSDFIKSLLH